MKLTFNTVLLMLASLQLFAQSEQTINPLGGTSTSFTDGLKVVVNTTGKLAVYRANKTQYCCGSVYPAGSTGGVNLTFRFDNGTTYNNTSAAFTACSTTPALQVGNLWTTSMSGYTTSTISGKKFFVTINFTYIFPNKYFLMDYYVRAPSDLATAETVHLYLDHDTYIKGDDKSVGYRASNTTGEFVGNYRTTANGTTGVNSSHGFKTKDGFRSYYTGAYSARNTTNASTLKLSNTLSTTYVDDGVAVEFTIGPLSAGMTGAKQVLHGYGEYTSDFTSITVDDPVVSSLISTPVTLNFTSVSFMGDEGNTSHAANEITLVVSGGTLNTDQTASFTISGGTAVSGTDYTYVKGFVIPAGSYTTPQTLTLSNVTIIGNLNCQANRTFNIAIDNSTCNDLLVSGATNQATYTIVDDDVLLSGDLVGSPIVCTNAASSLAVQAPTGGPGSYTYTWQSSTNGTTWSNISGATAATYTAPATITTKYYRRGVTSATCGIVYSDPFTVDALPAATISASGSVNFCSGESVTLNITTSNGSKLQWYRNGAAIADAIQATYIATESGDYTATSSNNTCTSPISNSITVETYPCVVPLDDETFSFECQSVLVNVMDNDDLGGLDPILAISVPPTLGTATVEGNKIRYEDSGNCDGDENDEFTYSLCFGPGCSFAKVRVGILRGIRLEDSCSFNPKLTCSPFNGASFSWEYSDNGTVWNNVQTGVSNILSVSQAGFYRVSITYLGNTAVSQAVELAVDTFDLPGGTWFRTTVK